MDLPAQDVAHPMIHVFPQPAHGRVQITGPLLVEITVIDARGRTGHMQRSAPASSITCDLSALGPGRYALRAMDAAGATSTAALVLY
jgi:hypothetical protein